MPKVWQKQNPDGTPKFLVLRRDGTKPEWPWYVLGARDPASPHSLRTHAMALKFHGETDIEYLHSVWELGDDFIAYREQHGDGDPAALPHREDHPVILRLMRGEVTFEEVLKEAYAAGFKDGSSMKTL